MRRSKALRVALLGLLLAIALILGYIERLFPFDFGVPGVKLGLPNLAVLFSLYYLGRREAFALSLLRVALSGLLFFRATSVLFSLTGALLSFFVMYFLKKFSPLGVPGVSVAGAASHNLGQVICASFVLETRAVFIFLPPLLLFSCIAGMLNGLLAAMLLRRLSAGGVPRF